MNRASLRPNATERRSAYARFLALALASIGISGAAVVISALYVLGVVNRAAGDIAEDAIPSVVTLVQARSDLRQLQTALMEHLDGTTGDPRIERERIAAARRKLGDDLERYHAFPIMPGEAELWSDIQVLIVNMDRLTEPVLAAEPTPVGRSTISPLARDVRRAADELDAVLVRAIRLDAGTAKDLSQRIFAVHRRALPVALGLSVIGSLVAVAAILTAHRLVEDALRSEHLARDELERRATELEAFSGRVAHDLLSPLMTVDLALGIIEQTLAPADRERSRAVLARATRSLDGVRTLVDGLLQLARASARPKPGDRADACEIVRGTIEEHAASAREAGVDVELASCPPLLVRCSPGVLISLLSNLLQNAIKILRDHDVRRVTVRISREPPFARFEVEDTGPGLAKEFHATIFEPHVQGPVTGRSGFGLGLATVKRLAEACGGQVGLVSEPGKGALFWFTLPLVERSVEAPTA